MQTTRIGVIADTHYPSRIPLLPYPDIAQAFEGVSLILHAGDIETPEVLKQLGKIAPVEAVRGDDDPFDLPHKRLIEVDGVRIGLHHGARPLWMEARSRIANLRGKGGFNWGGIQTYLLKVFSQDRVRVIIFGHFHVPYTADHQGILLFNPGSVYSLTPESARWQLNRPQPRLRRAMLELAAAGKFQGDGGRSPTVGKLTIRDGAITSEIITLPPVSHP